VGYGLRVPSLQERVEERRRAVAIARHLRESERLSIAQIAARLGRSEATVKGYFYDPTGAKARVVKARYQGSCRQCGAPTQARAGKGDAYAYCKTCHPGAIQARWTRELVLEAMRAWQDRYGRAPARMTGRAPTPAGAAPTGSPASKSATGRPPARSATCSAPGRKPGPKPRDEPPRARAPGPPRRLR
jgi:AraC-like DNA-binding protein